MLPAQRTRSLTAPLEGAIEACSRLLTSSQASFSRHVCIHQRLCVSTYVQSHGFAPRAESANLKP